MHFTRRDICRAAWAGWLASLALPACHAPVLAAPALGEAASSTFRKTLEAGLRTQRPQEFAFVAMVAEKVEDGTLPRDLVESTFFWARRQRPYPFVYFEYGLKLRAKRLGIKLPIPDEKKRQSDAAASTGGK